ncbi:hypothetical protein ACFLWC_00850 [Chloroflexota bacterium]
MMSTKTERYPKIEEVLYRFGTIDLPENDWANTNGEDAGLSRGVIDEL